MDKIVTKDTLQQMLDGADFNKRAQIIGRALVVVFNNQTESEKTLNDTTKDNGVGFTSADARTGSLTAKSFLKNKTLQDWQVALWMSPSKSGFARITKYHAQLNVAANARKSSGA